MVAGVLLGFAIRIRRHIIAVAIADYGCRQCAVINKCECEIFISAFVFRGGHSMPLLKSDEGNAFQAHPHTHTLTCDFVVITLPPNAVPVT